MKIDDWGSINGFIENPQDLQTIELLPEKLKNIIQESFREVSFFDLPDFESFMEHIRGRLHFLDSGASTAVWALEDAEHSVLKIPFINTIGRDRILELLGPFARNDTKKLNRTFKSLKGHT